MIKLKGKILSSVLAITLLSSTGASAAGFNFRNVNYNRSYDNTYNDNSYKITYGYQDYKIPSQDANKAPSYSQDSSKIEYPVFNWQVVGDSSWGNTGVVIPPSRPQAKPDKEETVKPEVPARPETPVKPEVPKEDDKKPVETPQVETPSISGLSQIELEVLRLVNIERQKEGLSPLTTSSEFSNVARKKSEDMAVKGYFSHTSPTYGSPFEMMKSFGIPYRSAGENIAKGQTSAASVMRAWMNSSGHRANIMNPSFNKIGIGMYEKNGTKYWTQMFTN